MIELINTVPLDELPPAIFATIHSGHDEFSRLRLHRLVALVPADVQTRIHAVLPDATSRASAMRWWLRGLEAERAIRKVLFDIERDAEIRRARHSDILLANEIKECLG